MAFKFPKSAKAKLKESRAKKHSRYSRYIKHELSPVWIEEYEFPQYETCHLVDAYDNTCEHPCHGCHDCGKIYRAEPSGLYFLTFEHVNSR